MKKIDHTEDQWNLSDTFREVYLSQDAGQEQADGWNIVQSRLRTRAIRRKVLSCAAVLIPAAVLVGTGLMLIHPSPADSSQVIAVVESPSAPQTESAFIADSQLLAEAFAHQSVRRPAAGTGSLREPAADAATHGTEPVQPEAAASEPAGQATSQSVQEKPAGRTGSAESAPAGAGDFLDDDAFALADADERSGHRHRVVLGLGAGMTSTGSGTSLLMDSSTKTMADSSPFGDTIYGSAQDGAGSYEQGSFHHYMPVGTGISVAVSLTDRLYAETGLNYTLLRSDVQRGGSLIIEEQKLHLAGIPLRLYWRAADFEGFSLYTGAGGQVEKCLKATLDSETLSEKSLLWSLNVSAGAQYTFGRHVSLYFQPEYSLHLNDTQLKTIRTDHRTEFSLRCGLRFML